MSVVQKWDCQRNLAMGTHGEVMVRMLPASKPSTHDMLAIME